MTRETRTIVNTTCNLCGFNADGHNDFTEISVTDRSSTIESHDPSIIDVHVCSKCKSKLLKAWNAYCE